MAQYTGFILQPTYRVDRSEPAGTPRVQLFGRLDDGRSFLVTDDRLRPYLFVDERDRAHLGDAHADRAEPTALRSLLGEPVLRVSLDRPAEMPELRERLMREGARVHEADVRFSSRFLVDRGLQAGVRIEGEPEDPDAALWVFRNPELAPATPSPSLRILSLDIETTGDAKRILSVALAGAGTEEVHLCVPPPATDDGQAPPATAEDGSALHWHADEASLLETLIQRIQELDVDVVVGWNVADFDFRVIERRCRALGVRGHFGRVPGALQLRQDPGFTRQWRAEMPGRIVLDGLPLVRDALRLDDYRLETVAQHVLGRGKRISEHGESKVDEIQRLAKEEPLALAAYNLEDTRLVLEILDAEGLLDLTIERSLLSGMPLDRVGASIASFDLLYLGELRARGFVAPCVDRERKTEAVRGGAVLESTPGTFRNVAVFDFKSLYPSLIRSFQLDPLAHALAREEEDPLEAPNGARFARSGAILPEMIERFMQGRDAAKARGDRNADQAIKIMMNALFGVLGSASCRFFDPAVANAITSFGQQTLAWTREAFEAEGVETIYGDTDSVFVRLRHAEPGEEAEREARALRELIEARIETRIRDEYRCESKLTLELERVYERFFMPRVRGGSGGSKKRYAGWIEGRLDLVGLEAVRRDWPALAGRLQRGILEHLFTDRDPMPFVRGLTERMQAGELDGELVYVKRIRKGSLDRYTATTPPHVQAARKAGVQGSGVIRYVITTGGPEPVDPDADLSAENALPAPIDRRHYIEKVMRPIADALLPEVGSDFGEALGEPRQLALL